jgi:hypothetical protein
VPDFKQKGPESAGQQAPEAESMGGQGEMQRMAAMHKRRVMRKAEEAPEAGGDAGAAMDDMGEEKKGSEAAPEQMNAEQEAAPEAAPA